MVSARSPKIVAGAVRSIRDTDPDSQRRIVAASKGREAWYKIWNELPFKSDVLYLPEAERSLLEQKVISALTGLEQEEYGAFCWQAHEYRTNRNTHSKDFFPGLPALEQVQAEYITKTLQINQKYERTGRLDRVLPPIAAGISFIGGAIIGGEMAEYVNETTLFQNFVDAICFPQMLPYVERIAAGVGGVVGGILGLILSSEFGTRKYESKVLTESCNLQKLIYDDFAGRVKSYLQKRT